MKNQINNFYLEFNTYIDYNKKEEIKDKYEHVYYYIKKKKFKNKYQRKFKKNYKHLEKYVEKYNKIYIEKNLNIDILNNVNGCSLDNNQKKAILTDEINNLVIAGAGSGKTLTIIGKIMYLIEIQNVHPKDILCISFTNDSCNSLKRKINNKVEVLTFHKLALKILCKKNYNFISMPLDYVVDEYFNSIIYNNEYMVKKALKLLDDSSNDINNYKKYLNSNKLKNLKHTIITFINLLKSNNYSLNIFLKIKNKKNKDILSIIIDIYYLYEQELKSKNEIDFNDMINLATKEVTNSSIMYKYIIVDEYQDTSYTRYKLLKAILDKTKSKLMAVGDDWQSIYKFTGCDINIFLKFEKYFGYTKKMYITNTYRNSQELINIAGNFILKNKKQIYKKLNSNKHNNKPIKILYEEKDILEKLIKYLIGKNKKNILILGRNNNDIYKYLNKNLKINKDIISYNNNKNLNIRYLTVHKSKGLEEECVIIINLIDDILGFPNKMKNEDVIEQISTKNNYPFEEERRLFYVALTRTKNDNYLIIPTKKTSIFIKEILKINKKNIEYIDI